MIGRSALKALVEAGLVRSGTPVLGRMALRRRSLVCAYHNVVPDDCPLPGDRSLHLRRRTFIRQIEHLQRVYDVVPLEDVLAPPPPRGRPRVALTFDDAYRGAVTIGVEELAARGLPATVFVVPSCTGNGPFWWDAIEGGLDAGRRTHAVEELAGRDGDVRRWAEAAGLRLGSVTPWALAASEDELRAATRHGGITLGSHTWSHLNLARIPPAELARELVLSLTWLQQRFSAAIPWISYPYGRSSPAVESAAAAAGYVAGVSLCGGWFPPPGPTRYAVPRLNVPAGLSVNGFVLRTAGLA